MEEKKITMILEAGRWSPTAVNLQPPRILVLNTPESLAKVRQFCSFGYKQNYVGLAKECDDSTEDFIPNMNLGGHRKPPEETCFWNEATKDFAPGRR